MTSKPVCVAAAKLGLCIVCCVALLSQEVNSLVYVRGAGASFPYEVYKVWMPIFKSSRQKFVDIYMDYKSVGSGNGKKMIKGEAGADAIPIEYAGSDSLLEESDYTTYPDLQMFPMMAGAIVLGFNLPGVSSLNLTREITVGIYDGSYKYWNDTDIQTVNPDVQLPYQPIIPIARADKSGSTEIFTSALSSFSNQWASEYGTFSGGLDSEDQAIKWNSSHVKMYGYTQIGVSGLILSVRYSIGYISLSGAEETKITYANLFNAAGNLVGPDQYSVQNAMDDFSSLMSSRLTSSLADAPGAHSYPIAGYTYFVIHLNWDGNCDSRVELYRYIEWSHSDGVAQRECVRLGMTPVSSTIAASVAAKVLPKIKCQGQNVAAMVADQKAAEELSLQTWRTSVTITVPIVVVLLGVLSVYIIRQQIKMNKAIIYDEWKIAFNDINLTERGSKTGWASTSAVAKSISSFGTGKSVDSMKETWKWMGSTVKIGYWDDRVVALRSIDYQRPLSRQMKKTVLWMRDSIMHQNVVQFFGLTQNENRWFFVSDFCMKGALCDILQNDKYNLDNNFKFSIATDIANGMSYIHQQGIIHGRLSSSSCHIDSRWNVKITDWEFLKFNADISGKEDAPVENGSVSNNVEDPISKARIKFWTAPELMGIPVQLPSKMSDVYSFAVLTIEVFTREDPYHELTNTMDPPSIINSVMNRNLRPELGKDIPTALHPLISLWWSDPPTQRPSFQKITRSLKKANPSKKSVLDCMMEVVEGYVLNLEGKIEERTAELAVAMKNMETLLHKILPPSVAEKLSKGETIQPQNYESVTIFFSDIVGFTTISAMSTPIQIIDLLNDLYSKFDNAIDQHDVYKVETIGDAYMVISGLPKTNGQRHAAEIAKMALRFLDEAAKTKIQHLPQEKLCLRAGIHSGPVAAGVVGVKMPRYCLFGDTVNTASRMESTSEAMKIQVSETSEKLLRLLGNFDLEPRGEVTVKGKGVMNTYWLLGSDDKETSSTTDEKHSFQPKSASTHMTPVD